MDFLVVLLLLLLKSFNKENSTTAYKSVRQIVNNNKSALDKAKRDV